MHLYHVTFKDHVDSIFEHGLGAFADVNRNFECSNAKVYLSTNIVEAEDYVMSSNTFIDRDLADENDLVVLVVESHDLDQDALWFDHNVPFTRSSYQYHKIIPPSAVKIYNGEYEGE